MRASRVDEEKEERSGFLKSNISRCVYAFRQVMMFSRSVYFVDLNSAIRFVSYPLKTHYHLVHPYLKSAIALSDYHWIALSDYHWIPHLLVINSARTFFSVHSIWKVHYNLFILLKKIVRLGMPKSICYMKIVYTVVVSIQWFCKNTIISLFSTFCKLLHFQFSTDWGPCLMCLFVIQNICGYI